jgi:DNA-binding transcriptional LysR family regulator
MVYEFIKYFTTVYETGSLLQASQKLYVSQQGISQGIKRLEESFNNPLFIRERNKLVPSEFGREFYKRATPILEMMQALENYALNYRVNNANEIKVGLLGYNIFSHQIAALIQSFQSDNPEIKLVTTFYDAKQLDLVRSKVLSGDLDLAWQFNVTFRDEFNYITIKDAPVKLLINADHPLNSKEVITWMDLKGEPLVTAGSHDPFDSIVVTHCEKNGFSPNVAFYSTETIYIATLINENRAVIPLNSNYIDTFKVLCPNSAVRDITPTLNVNLSLITKKHDLSEELKVLASYLSSNLKERIQGW